MKQLLLVDRLGADFFQRAPECPGVYLMRSPADEVLYVGKAKNLRKRLNTYRVANPDRMSRRHLRLVNSVTRIELHQCDSEASALAKEAALLRNLRPRFNRAGTWPGSPHYLIWRMSGPNLELGVTRTLEPGWSFLGPIGPWATSLRNTLLRLLWCALFPDRSLADMPHGWFRGHRSAITAIPIPSQTSPQEISKLLSNLSHRQTKPFLAWIESRVPQNPHPFESLIRTTDLEFLAEIDTNPEFA
jgi:predicted GIY-YIG superfamily endonuclease